MTELMYCGYHLLGASIGHSCCLCFAGTPLELLCKGLLFYYNHRLHKQLVAMQLLARGLTCALAHSIACSFALFLAGSPTTQLII